VVHASRAGSRKAAAGCRSPCGEPATPTKPGTGLNRHCVQKRGQTAQPGQARRDPRAGLRGVPVLHEGVGSDKTTNVLPDSTRGRTSMG
jgi:hypothetical protein